MPRDRFTHREDARYHEVPRAEPSDSPAIPPADQVIARSAPQRPQGPDSPYQTGEMPFWGPRFFEIFRQTGNVRLAAKAAGVSHATAYNYYHGVPVFKLAWDEAVNEARDLLLQEAWDRALHKSDRMLAMLLRAYWPELFGAMIPKYGQQVTQNQTNTFVFSGVDTDAIRRRLERRFLPDPTEDAETGDFIESE